MAVKNSLGSEAKTYTAITLEAIEERGSVDTYELESLGVRNAHNMAYTLQDMGYPIIVEKVQRISPVSGKRQTVNSLSMDNRDGAMDSIRYLRAEKSYRFKCRMAGKIKAARQLLNSFRDSSQQNLF